MQSFLQTEQSESDQDDVKMVVLKIPSKGFIKRSTLLNGRPDGRKAVDGSANQNLRNYFLKSELNIMYGERRGIHVIQHNTNDTTTGEKPEYMPLGLAFSKDVYHRNNNNDCYQATMNNMGMTSGRMTKEQANQSSGKATAKIACKTASAAITFQRGNRAPYDSDSEPAHRRSTARKPGSRRRSR